MTTIRSFLKKEDNFYLLLEDGVGRLILDEFDALPRQIQTENLMYIEQVTFSEPYSLDLVGGDDQRLNTFLAQQKGILNKEQAEDVNRTIFHAKDRDIVVSSGTNIVAGNGGGGIIVNGDLIYEAAFVPIGGIILWSGAIADIPVNWQLCNGLNGTPDLRNRFVVGAGDTRNPDDTGGQLTIDIEHSHTADGTLAAASDTHSHGPGTLNTDNDTHSHSADGTLATGVPLGDTVPVDDDLTGSTTTVASTVHTHDVTGDTDNDTHDHDVNSGLTADDAHSHDVTGNTSDSLSTTQDITPLFYALAYIQRML